jgi:membrane-bound lytic murein transglycosylase D
MLDVAWAPPANDPDHADREALAEMERASFPLVGESEVASGLRRTIRERPPQPWMARLALPAIPVRWNRQTVTYLEYFRDDERGRAMIRAWFRRLGRYEARLRAILRTVGVPEDLLFVAMAESGFNPRRRSRVGAAGMWQFTEGTGRVYGLAQGYWVDDRYDVEKSTHAAALYLKDLRARFGSWELALAGYNAGYALVMRTISRHNTNNFWALSEIESGLPYSTVNYVPKIIAGAIVGRNREVFGCDAKTIEPYPPVDWIEVEVRQSTKLATVARVIDEDEDLVRELNAQLVRGRTPPRPGEYSIRIPREKLEAWERGQRRVRADWVSETTYTVRHGERLAAIAARHDIGKGKLARLNGLEDSAELEGGLTIVVPARPARLPGDRAAAPPTEKPLAAVPHLVPEPGHRVVLFEATRASTPRKVAGAFAARWDEIVAWNDLDPQARLQDGQILQIVVRDGFSAADVGVVALELDDVHYVVRGSREHIEASLERRGLVRRAYRVRRGDTLRRIGRRFDLTTGDLARINGFSRRHDPEPGDVLIVYVEKGRTRGTREPPDPAVVYPVPDPQTTDDQLATGSERAPSTATTNRVPGPSTAPHQPSTSEKDQRRPSTATTSRVPSSAPVNDRRPRATNRDLPGTR